MKKLLLSKLALIIICAAALLFPPGADRAAASSAEPRYAQAVSQTAYFFSQKDLSSSLFAVPYTYCVQVIREDGQWYYARYAEDEGIYRALYGYVLKDDFALLDEPPAATYLIKSLKVTYSAGTIDPSLPALGEIEMEAAFYGTYYSGATAYSYVLCGDTFGYVEGAGGDYPLNPLPSAREDEEPADEGGGAVTAVIIAALAAGALVLVFISVRKKKSAPP